MNIDEAEDIIYARLYLEGPLPYATVFRETPRNVHAWVNAVLHRLERRGKVSRVGQTYDAVMSDEAKKKRLAEQMTDRDIRMGRYEEEFPDIEPAPFTPRIKSSCRRCAQPTLDGSYDCGCDEPIGR